jgi:hypothetical protein
LNFGGAVLCRCENGQKFNKDQECVVEEDCFPVTTTEPTTTTAMTTTMGHAGMEMKEETTTVAFQTSVAGENVTQGRFLLKKRETKLRVKNQKFNLTSYAWDNYRFMGIA